MSPSECFDKYLPTALADRVVRKVRVASGGCWEWMGGCTAKGYGRLGVDGKDQYVHRLVCAAVNGLDLSGMLVCHKCDNPCCCNPAHLFVGTLSDNAVDMVQKQRHFYGQQPQRIMRGEQHPQHKLTHDEVLDIVRCFNSGESKMSLSKRFEVDRRTIQFLLAGQTWSSVTGITQVAQRNQNKPSNRVLFAAIK